MNQIKEIALKIFSINESIACECEASHEICLQCNKCRVASPDNLALDFHNLNQYIDHTLLRADATYDDILNLCEETNKFAFKSVCVNPFFIGLAKKHIKTADICTVVGFPLGANICDVKVFEANKAIELGVNEIDMVINISGVKFYSSIVKNFDIVPLHISTNKGYKSELEEEPVVESETSLPYITRKIVEWATEIATIATFCTNKNIPLKIIIETCLLTKEEIIIACLVAKKAGADFVKTSTGFSTKGADVENVKLMREVVGAKMGVKASGGIKTKENAITMLKAGANRLGTSNSVAIIQK